MQSALGIVQLSKCDAMNQSRCRIAERYTQEFSSVNALELPEILPDRTTSWHLYVLRLRLEQLRIDRAGFIRELSDRGVSASVHFIPLHLQPFYQRTFNYKEGDFPAAEREYQRCLSLPLYPTMSEEEVEQVIWAVRDVVSCWTK
jgi:dTDP-4-amino-4,6-dideoxygalactose transaminase